MNKKELRRAIQNQVRLEGPSNVIVLQLYPNTNVACDAWVEFYSLLPHNEAGASYDRATGLWRVHTHDVHVGGYNDWCIRDMVERLVREEAVIMPRDLWYDEVLQEELMLQDLAASWDVDEIPTPF
jgi:hypothetical protein